MTFDASRDIYAQTFDQDVQQTDQNTCPEWSGRVTTDTHGTVCEDCGLVIVDVQIDRGRRVASSTTIVRASATLVRRTRTRDTTGESNAIREHLG